MTHARESSGHAGASGSVAQAEGNRHVELVHEALGALLKGDEQEARKLLEPDVVLHFPGRGPLAGDFKGTSAVVGWMQHMPEAASGAGRLRFTLGSTFADEQRGVLLFVTSLDRDGKTTHERSVAVFALRNHRVAEVWVTPMDLYASDQLWGAGAGR